MKPRTLKLAAFGPYKDTLELDFDDLGDHGLFLLHGPTGAGKTTILDAMCFALYGDTSGGEREMKELRSDLASDTAVARVEFEFSLGQERYRVERMPTQARPGRRTDLQHEAHLFRVTPYGTEHIASGVTEVKGRVRELLGLTADQFRQVVVLPQGQFRKLLTADSKEREGILKVLFDTTSFLGLEELLIKRAKEASDLARDYQRDLDACLKTHEALTINDLEQKVEQRKGDCRDADGAVIDADARRQEARDALERAKEDDAVFRAFDQAVEQQARIAAAAPERAVRARRLQDAERAATVRPLEKPIQAAVGTVQKLENASSAADKEAGKAVSAWQDALQALDAEEGRADERARAADRVRFLEGLRGNVAEYERVKEQLHKRRGEIEGLQQRLNTINDELGRLNLPELHEALQRAEQATQRVPELTRQVEALRNRVDAKRALEKTEKELEKARTADGEATRDVNDKEQAWNDRKLEHALLRKRFLAEQAGVLAKDLQEGVPCAVCGATHHPAPAARAHDAPTQADVERAASDEDTAFEILKLTQATARQTSSNMSTLALQLAALLGELGDDAATPLKTLQTAHQQARQTLNTASEAASLLDQARTRYEDAVGRQSRLEGERTDVQTQCDRLQGGIEESEQHVQTLAQRLPADARSVSALTNLLDQVERTLCTLESSLESAKNCEEAARGAKESAENHANTQSMLLDRARTDLQQHQDTLATAWREAGFEDVESYRAAALEPAELVKLAGRVQQDILDEKEAQRVLEQARQSVEGKIPPDLTAAQSTQQGADAAYDDAVRQQVCLKSELQTLEGGCSRATELDIALFDAQQASQRLEGLAAAAKGATGQRISFHRYVLGACLDEVLLIASQRLRDMSRDRYELRRADDERGGLELEVFDHYTGRARSTKSLSGGESFQAALSLALGLADVVQHRSGGRHLETVFIDEGFGSLDPEALDLAMDCLIELQSNGRLVGIISHVQELRHHVEARLEVSASPDGSTARFVVA